MKGITYCGACADYDIKKHLCKRGAKLESNPQDKFFDDCPLPIIVPIVRCKDCKHFREYITVGTVTTIYALERGTARNGRIDTIELLADALRISIDEYIGRRR